MVNGLGMGAPAVSHGSGPRPSGARGTARPAVSSEKDAKDVPAILLPSRRRQHSTPEKWFRDSVSEKPFGDDGGYHAGEDAQVSRAVEGPADADPVAEIPQPGAA